MIKSQPTSSRDAVSEIDPVVYHYVQISNSCVSFLVEYCIVPSDFDSLSALYCDFKMPHCTFYIPVL